MDNKITEVGFYNPDGTMKSKEVFMKELNDIYDNVSNINNCPQSYIEALSDSENLLAPEDLLIQYQFTERKIYLNEEIDDATGINIVQRIQFWNDEDTYNNIPLDARLPIQIYIDTPGGSLTSTFEIIDAIQLSKTPVHTIVTGTAFSAGFFIAIAGHTRYGYEHSTYLFHEGSNFFSGDAHKVNQQAIFYKDILLKQLKKHTLNHTKFSEDIYNEHYRDDWFFDANDAIKYGVIDAICTNLNGGDNNE